MMSADDAIKMCRARMREAAGNIEELCVAVNERVAVRAAPGEWLVTRHRSAVRLFLETSDGHVSRYVWRWQDTDSIIDALAEAAAA